MFTATKFSTFTDIR